MRIEVRRLKGGKGSETYYVRIPKHLFESLGRPMEFELELRGDEIRLKPVKMKGGKTVFKTRTLRFTMYGDGWNVEVGREWRYVDTIEVEGRVRRVRLPSRIAGDEVGEIEMEGEVLCTTRTVEDPAYPSGCKTVLECREQ